MNKTAELHVYMHNACCKLLIYKDCSSAELSHDHLTCTIPSLGVVFSQQCAVDWLDLVALREVRVNAAGKQAGWWRGRVTNITGSEQPGQRGAGVYQ